MSIDLTKEVLASKGINDSTVAGASIKDALETLAGAPIDYMNMPIGSVLQRWNKATTLNHTLPIVSEWVNAATKWSAYNQHNMIVTNMAADDVMQSYTSAITANRRGLGFDGTHFLLYDQYLNWCNRTNNGLAVTAVKNFNAMTLTAPSAFIDFMTNFQERKTVILTQFNSRAYYYTEDYITYTPVIFPVVGTNVPQYNTPYISGNVYSFFLTGTKRIYTTDHINFFDCVGFGSVSLPIHRMSNGHLYTTTSMTLRISTDNGITWTSSTLPAATNSTNHHCLDFDGTTYVYGTTSNALYSSTTALSGSWTLRTSNIAGSTILHRVYYCNSVWFVMSATTSTTSFSTSTDGITWANRSAAASMIGYSVGYAGGRWLIVSAGATYTSTDGITWGGSISVGNSAFDIDSRCFYANGTIAALVGSASSSWLSGDDGILRSFSSSTFVSNVYALNTSAVTGLSIKLG